MTDENKETKPNTEPVKAPVPNKDSLPVFTKPEPTPNRIIKAEVVPTPPPIIEKPIPTPNRVIVPDKKKDD
jgi:hypothetical protein